MTQTSEHQGRGVVVTGGSGGIGGAISKRLIAEGAGVHVLDLKPSMDQMDASFHQLDVSSEADVDHVFGAIGAQAGKIDYLVCGAGIYRCQPRPQTADHPPETNLQGLRQPLLQAVIPFAWRQILFVDTR